MAPLPPVAQLVVCVGVSTTPYESIHSSTPHKFRAVVFLNTIQSLFSALSALTFLLITKHRPQMSLPDLLGLNAPPPQTPILVSSTKSSSSRDSNSNGNAFRSPRKLLKSYFFISLVSSLASPFGFLSLSHISFPTLLLGKSCKLVPVMAMNIVLYRRKFPPHKYLLVGMVTAGIWAFMAFKEGTGSKKGAPETSSLLGLVLLGINLILDGVVNSTQDEVFKNYRIDGPQMMFFMNVFSTAITVVAMMVPSALTPGFLAPAGADQHFNALSTALSFISEHPAVLKDILLFSITGAIGQLFIFLTLSLYGSLTLVTITVTRKMVTMLLSVFIFDHHLMFGQWGGVGIVFAAIGMEAEVKRRETRQKKSARKQ
ncbi:solute carrier family 35 (UDP-galactose transporter), member B1, partial [Phenoliferia sp. Uapishka_3]